MKTIGGEYVWFYDGGRLRQGPVTRSMIRHLQASEESEAPVQIKMLKIF